MALSTGFLPLRDVLSCKSDSCFIGAITNIQAPVQLTKPGGDYMISFTIKDKFPGDEKDAVPCTIKRRRVDHLPKGDPGDVAILRGMKVEILGLPPKKTLVNCSELQSEVLFFPARSIPAPEVGHDFLAGGTSKLPYQGMFGSKPPSRAEETTVIHMKAAAAPLLEELKAPGAMYRARLGPTSIKSKKGKRQHLLSEWTFGLFYDLVGEVVKTFWGTSDSVDLYVTDYTTNKDFFLYEEKKDGDYFTSSRKAWPGPLGQMTIQIRAYEPHAGKARELKEGDFVFLQNVRAKVSQSNTLEGAMHGDPQYPDKICIRKCTHQEQLRGLLARKAEYEKNAAASRLNRDSATNVPKKPSAITAQKKKQHKREKKRLQREQMQKELEAEQANSAGTATKGLNKNVCSGDRDVGISTVEEIVNNPYLKTITETSDDLLLPFVNSRYRTRLRVVDHYPLRLRDFTRSTNDPLTSQASISTSSNENSLSTKDGSSPARFAWHFFLLVEDADAPVGTTPARFPLTIDTARAQCLLKMDPVDFSVHPNKLSELERKLFILWGNLHERKILLKKQGIDLPLPVGDERLKLSNTPFECCVEEYGVPVDEKGNPFTDAEIDDFLSEMKDPTNEAGALAVQIFGNPETWKRTWSPYNTIIKD